MNHRQTDCKDAAVGERPLLSMRGQAGRHLGEDLIVTPHDFITKWHASALKEHSVVPVFGLS